MKQKDALDADIEKTENEQKDLKVEIEKMVNKIGNIVQEGVPVSWELGVGRRLMDVWMSDFASAAVSIGEQ